MERGKGAYLGEEVVIDLKAEIVDSFDLTVHE